MANIHSSFSRVRKSSLATSERLRALASFFNALVYASARHCVLISLRECYTERLANHVTLRAEPIQVCLMGGRVGM